MVEAPEGFDEAVIHGSGRHDPFLVASRQAIWVVEPGPHDEGARGNEDEGISHVLNKRFSLPRCQHVLNLGNNCIIGCNIPLSISERLAFEPAVATTSHPQAHPGLL